MYSVGCLPSSTLLFKCPNWFQTYKKVGIQTQPSLNVLNTFKNLFLVVLGFPVLGRPILLFAAQTLPHGRLQFITVTSTSAGVPLSGSLLCPMGASASGGTLPPTKKTLQAASHF